MSVLTTMTGYATARTGNGSALATIAGTTLAAAGALSFNQWWEWRTDACMERTSRRPLPRGNISPRAALAWSLAFSVSGVVVLAWWVNAPAAALAAATIVLYGFVYTPLKRRTRWATEIGALSGALPALIGNAAAGWINSRPGLVLTAVLLLWQMPHFYAIGWRHRLDYRAAGFPLLPAVDVSGARTAAWSFAYAILLFAVSLAPWAMGWLGGVYGVTALCAGMWFLRSGWQFAAADDRDRAAGRLFFASIFYLPLVMGGLMVDRLLSR
jgi:protoheme IX farnesyltransferase